MHSMFLSYNTDFCFLLLLLKRMYIYEDLTNLHIEDFVEVKMELTIFCSRLKERFGGMMRDFFPEKLYVISSPDSELLQVTILHIQMTAYTSLPRFLDKKSVVRCIK